MTDLVFMGLAGHFLLSGPTLGAKMSPSPWRVEDVVTMRCGFLPCTFAGVIDVFVLLVSTPLPLLSAGASYKQERADRRLNVARGVARNP